MLIRSGVHGSFVEYKLFRLPASVLNIRCACVFPLLYANCGLLIRRVLVLLPPVCLSELPCTQCPLLFVHF